jgi:hypothetical protein
MVRLGATPLVGDALHSPRHQVALPSVQPQPFGGHGGDGHAAHLDHIRGAAHVCQRVPGALAQVPQVRQHPFRVFGERPAPEPSSSEREREWRARGLWV